MYNFIKRFFDIFFSILVLPIVLLVIGLSAIFIKLEDRGSIFYKANRTGRYGRAFKMYKLRSMKENAPDIRMSDGSTYNAENDQRVTKFGRFARKTSIDELPQILNILKGDMSFIGPRPDSASYIDKYTEEERVILKVRPGLTGYNQAINRNAVGTKQKLQNDIYYVEHMSLLFDIKIIFLTIKSVLFSKNVYRSQEDDKENKTDEKNNDSRGKYFTTSSDNKS